MRYFLFAGLISVAFWATGCQTTEIFTSSASTSSEPVVPRVDVQPDLHIGLFEIDGNKPPISQVDAFHIPHQLTRRLRESGFWSSVQITPTASYTADFFLWGEVVKGTAQRLELNVALYDASGATWLEKRFVGKADRSHDELAAVSPFHSMLDQITREVNQAIATKLNPISWKMIRQISSIRFARGLAPDAFEDYLEIDSKGIAQLTRLPADDDPMMDRVERIRSREESLIASMDAYYGKALDEINPSYLEWQNYAARESHKQQKYARRSWLDGALLIAGELTNAGAMFVDSFEGEDKEGDADGVTLADRGYEQGKAWSRGYGQRASELEQRLARSEHLASVEMEPYVIEVEGTTERLTGTAIEQYAQWRVLLAKIYAKEVGL